MSAILVIAEQEGGIFRKGSFETVAQARKIADRIDAQVIVLVLAPDPASDSSTFAELGADRIMAAAGPQFDHMTVDLCYPAVLAAAREVNAGLVILTATTLGKDLAPRLAVALDAALASDCTAFEVDGNEIEVERPLYAGKVLARLRLKAQVKILTLRPNVFESPVSRPGSEVKVEPFDPPASESPAELVELNRSEGASVDVSEADVIVTGGRGMRGPENFKILTELADLLNGAVGATRAAVDAGWRPHKDQVGQTGKVVSPKLYIMCGASGSVQHWAGMSGSKCIVAINRDANAPIVSRADYSIVGDLFEVVPALVKALQS